MIHFAKYHPGLEHDFEYKCKECEEFLPSREELRRHTYTTHAKPVFDMGRCNVCGKMFVQSFKLKPHFRIFHPGLEFDADFKCVQCDEYFKTKEEVIEHAKLSHSQTGFVKVESSYKKIDKKARGYNIRVNARCAVCKSIFITNATLKKHYRNHHPGFEFKTDYKCLQCDEFFPTTREVREHAKVEHQGKDLKPKNAKTYDMCRCNVCQKEFIRTDRLKEHFERYHPGLELKIEFKCNGCDAFLESYSALRQHFRFEHEDVKYTSTGNLIREAEEGNFEDQGVAFKNLYQICRCYVCELLFLKPEGTGSELKTELQCAECEVAIRNDEEPSLIGFQEKVF